MVAGFIVGSSYYVCPPVLDGDAQGPGSVGFRPSARRAVLLLCYRSLVRRRGISQAPRQSL